MFIGASIIVIGTIVQATCHNLGGFMGGRFILGFGVAISASAGPTYVSEMAHPTFRGTMTAIYNTFWFVGGIPGTFVPYGTSSISGSIAWRIPTWVQMTFSGIVLIFCLFLPEVRLPDSINAVKVLYRRSCTSLLVGSLPKTGMRKLLM